MSAGELERVEVMGRVANEELKLTDAAAMLQLSYRQVKRLWRRYRQKGSQGLQHGNVGRVSNRSKPAKFRRRVLSLIQKKYSGSEEERFGPTLAAEHLAEEDGIAIDHETLRGWMLAEGLWSRQRKRKKHCQRRERLSSCTLRPEWTWFVIKGVRSISANVVVPIDRIIVLNDRKISPRPLCRSVFGTLHSSLLLWLSAAEAVNHLDLLVDSRPYHQMKMLFPPHESKSYVVRYLSPSSFRSSLAG